MTARYVDCSTVAEMVTGPMKDEVAVVDVRDDVSRGWYLEHTAVVLLRPIQQVL